MNAGSARISAWAGAHAPYQRLDLARPLRQVEEAAARRQLSRATGAQQQFAAAAPGPLSHPPCNAG